VTAAPGGAARSELDPTDPEADDRTAFPYQPALDGLRALSVLAVIAYHNGYVWAVGGFLGVDAFFVLSGYLITTLLVLEYRRADAIGLVAFWGRRVRRLAPALLLVLIFVALYGLVAVRPFEIDKLRYDSLASLFYVANWRFIVSGQSYFDLFSTPSPLRHLWSLAIEEQFYLVWPVVVLGCLRWRRGRTTALAVVATVGAAASVIAMHSLYDPQDPSRAYFGTDTRVHTILVGALLALLLLRAKPLSAVAARALQLAALVTLAGVAWSWHVVNATDAGYYGVGSLLYAMAIALVIAAAVQPRSAIGRALGLGPLRSIGQISYGLYLWHWPVIVWLIPARVGFGDSRLVAVRLVVTFVAAGLSYRFVESPIRHGRWFPRASRTSRWALPVALAVTGSILVVATVGAAAPPQYLRFGYPIPCPHPTHRDVVDARRAIRSAGAANPAAGLPPIAVMGDSVACSLTPGLEALHTDRALHYRQGAVIACGIVSDVVLPSSAIPLVPAQTRNCRGFADSARRDAIRHRARILVWMSGWERADLTDHGVRVRAGTAAWSKVLIRRMDRVVSDLHRHGVHLVVTTVPPNAEGEIGGVAVRPNAATEQTYSTLNRFLFTFVARHPGEVSLVDLAGHVCPVGPPCPRTFGAIAPRAIDGMHYTPQGSVWLLDWLLPQIRAAAPPAGTGA
jgi:peptidoglycan/LPS O-acetylase OafA/YrhL